MCRTCRHIDPSPSFVFIGPPPSRRLPPGRWRPDEGSPGRRSRLSVTLTGRRLPPPPSARPPPPPPNARPAPPAPGRRQGGGRQDTPVMASARRKTEVLTLGAKNRPPKNRRVFNFCTKRCAVYFWAGIEKIKAIERILRKIFTKNMRGGQNLPPPLSSARVNAERHKNLKCWRIRAYHNIGFKRE